jgi:hypothetical protein
MIAVLPELVEVNGRTMVRVTVKEEDRIIDADVVNPLSSAQRRKVAARLAKRAGDELLAEKIEEALLQCVGMIQEEEQALEEPVREEEAGDIHTCRPELILEQGVVAISVPEVVIRNGEAVGRWRLYLRLPSGERQTRELPQSLDITAEKRLWLIPQPPDPPAPCVSAWSRESREAWMGGASADRREVFAQLCAALEEYLDVPNDGQSTATEFLNMHPAIPTLALWTMLTYAYPAWDAVPYLYVSGPAGSGKTRVFELLSRLVFRPISSSNLSASALFRTLHDRGGTLLLDEAERLTDGSPEVAELRSILLAGYKKGGKATRLESTGDSFTMVEFEVFGPKAIACIAGLPGPLLSRCIPIQMFRSAPDSPKPRRRLDADPSRWQRLRDSLHTLVLSGLGEQALVLRSLDDICPLGGRHYELWQPIMALAHWIDTDQSWGLEKMLMGWAKKLVIGHQEDQVPEEDQCLLRALTELVLKGKCPTNKEVLYKAQVMDDAITKRMSPKMVSNVLRKYGLMTVKVDARRELRVSLEQMKTIERNYGLDINTDGKERVQVLMSQY